MLNLILIIQGSVCDYSSISLIWRGPELCTVSQNITPAFYNQSVINIQRLYKNNNMYSSFNLSEKVLLIQDMIFFVNVTLNVSQDSESQINLYIFDAMKSGGQINNVTVFGTINIISRNDQIISSLDLFNQAPKYIQMVNFSIKVYQNNQSVFVSQSNQLYNTSCNINESTIYQYQKYNHAFLSLNTDWEQVDNYYKNQYEYILLLEYNTLNFQPNCSNNSIYYNYRCLNLQYCPNEQYVLSINKTTNSSICLPVCANLSEVPVNGICQSECSYNKQQIKNSMGQKICISCPQNMYLNASNKQCLSNCSIIQVEDNLCISEQDCNYFIYDTIYQQSNIPANYDGQQGAKLSSTSIKKCYRQCPRNYFYKPIDDVHYQCVDYCENMIFQLEGSYYCFNDQGNQYLDTYKQYIFYYKIEINGHQYKQIMSQCPEGTRVNQATQVCEMQAIGLTINIAIGIGGSLICIVVAMAICGWTYLNTDNDRMEMQKQARQYGY